MPQLDEEVKTYEKLTTLFFHLTHGTFSHALITIPELCDGIINFRIRLGAVSKIIENVELSDEVSFW